MPPLNRPAVKEQRAPVPASTGVTAMIALMDELSQLMSQEAELVNNRRQAEHAELLKRKQRLTMDYRAGMKSIAAEPDRLKELPAELRLRLRSSAQKLTDISDRNARMLRTAVMATQRLIQNIVSIVKQETLTKNSYSNPMTAHLALGTYSPVCKPVAVSRTA
ncbi:MAG: hypothetical protein M3N08_00970 [Pseudomonadota bacterium]|nr:hypothetical protein [Pseudomonadota bacterium]